MKDREIITSSGGADTRLHRRGGLLLRLGSSGEHGEMERDPHMAYHVRWYTGLAHIHDEAEVREHRTGPPESGDEVVHTRRQEHDRGERHDHNGHGSRNSHEGECVDGSHRDEDYNHEAGHDDHSSHHRGPGGNHHDVQSGSGNDTDRGHGHPEAVRDRDGAA